MSLDAVRTLGVLLSMADIAVGESALELADCLDAKLDAERVLRKQASQVRELNGVHERLSQAGQVLQPELMGQVARQAMAAMTSCREAQAHCDDVEALLDDKRRILHALQNRHDMIQGLHSEARDAHWAEREHREAQAREELHLLHQWAQGGRRWM